MIQPVDSDEQFKFLGSSRPLSDCFRRSEYGFEGEHPCAGDVTGPGCKLLPELEELLLHAGGGDDQVQLHHLVVVPQQGGQVKVLVVRPAHHNLEGSPIEICGKSCLPCTLQDRTCLREDARERLWTVVDEDRSDDTSSSLLVVGSQDGRAVEQAVDVLELAQIGDPWVVAAYNPHNSVVVQRAVLAIEGILYPRSGASYCHISDLEVSIKLRLEQIATRFVCSQAGWSLTPGIGAGNGVPVQRVNLKSLSTLKILAQENLQSSSSTAAPPPMELRKLPATSSRSYLAVNISRNMIRLLPMSSVQPCMVAGSNKTIGDEGITVDFWIIKVHTSN